MMLESEILAAQILLLVAACSVACLSIERTGTYGIRSKADIMQKSLSNKLLKFKTYRHSHHSQFIIIIRVTMMK
jgi:hypothetical protein